MQPQSTPYVSTAADRKGVVLMVTHSCGHVDGFYYRTPLDARMAIPERQAQKCRQCLKQPPVEPDLFKE